LICDIDRVTDLFCFLLFFALFFYLNLCFVELQVSLHYLGSSSSFLLFLLVVSRKLGSKRLLLLLSVSVLNKHLTQDVFQQCFSDAFEYKLNVFGTDSTSKVRVNRVRRCILL